MYPPFDGLSKPSRAPRGLRSRAVLAVLAAGLGLGLASSPLHADEGLPDRDTMSGSGGGRTAGPAAGAPSLEGASANVKDMCRLDRENADFDAEIANQKRVIAEMERIIAESRKPGGPVPDISKLQAQGVAGKGVVSAGKSKPEHVRKVIEEYESKLNPQNLAGIIRLSNNITKERNSLKKERRAALGLGPDEDLPQHELESIEKMAGGRAYYANEIARSKEFIARLELEKRKRNRERVKIRTGMTDEEFEAYKGARSGCEAGSGGEQTAEDAGTDTAGTGDGGMGPGGGGAGSGGAGGANTGCTTQQQFRYGGGMGGGMSGGKGGGMGSGRSGPAANPDCGKPCPPAQGWQLPAGARCLGMADQNKPMTGGASGSRAPMDNKPGDTQAAGATNDGGGKGCGPEPACPVQSCKPVGWRCVNNRWIGGHCECPKDAF